MSFGLSAAAWTAIAATTAAAATIHSADQQRSSSNRALDVQKANAKRTQLLADEANNKANSKAPDIMALMSANALAGKAGQSGTMLTGPSGVDPSLLTLGKSTLLGG
jgi:hypothetical protein